MIHFSKTHFKRFQMMQKSMQSNRFENFCNIPTYGCCARAHSLSYMVPRNRVVLSPENKPHHVLNAKVMYNDGSLSRSKF